MADTYTVISEWEEDSNYYQISVTTKDGVKPFGPPFPFPPIIHVDMLREFLLTKSALMSSRVVAPRFG